MEAAARATRSLLPPLAERVLRIAMLLVRRSLQDDLPAMASALAYKTLLGLIPIMAALETRRRPNLLTAEALALALLTTSVIIVTVDAPLLRAGAEHLGLAYRVVD